MERIARISTNVYAYIMSNINIQKVIKTSNARVHQTCRYLSVTYIYSTVKYLRNDEIACV